MPGRQPRNIVQGLCVELGCCDDRARWGRGVRPKLAIATCDFRKEFAIRGHFPVDFNDAIAKECALQFFEQDEKRKVFFHNDAGEIGNSRFSPHDRGRILELLAELFCFQEGITRRNAKYMARQRSEDAEESPGDELADYEGGFQSDWGNEFDDDTEYVATDDYSSSSPAASEHFSEFDGMVRLPVNFPKSVTTGTSRSTTANQDGNERQSGTRIEPHIANHCQLIYPRGSSVRCHYDPVDTSQETSLEKFPTVQWLLRCDSSKTPRDAKHFMWRYMHETSTYSRDPTMEQTKLLLDKLMDYLRLTCSPPQHGQASVRVRKFIMLWTKKWSDRGFLEHTYGGLVRTTPQFEKALNSWKSLWCHRDHSSLAEERYDTSIGQKRKHDEIAEVDDNFPHKATRILSDGNALRAFLLESPRSENPRSTPYAISFGSALGSDTSRAYAPFEPFDPKPAVSNFERLKAPIANMLATSASTPQPADALAPMVEQSLPMVIENKEVAPQIAMPVDVPASFQPPGTPAFSPITPEPTSPSIDHSKKPVAEVIRSTEMPTEPNPNRPAPTHSTVEQPKPQPESIRPQPARPRPVRTRCGIQGKPSELEDKPPEIKYIVEDVDRQIDLENTLPPFEDSTVAEFLDLFSQQSGLGIDRIERVTFTLAFKDDTTIALKRSYSEERWTCIKGRMHSLFKLVRKKDPGKKDFVVWVAVDND